VLVTITLTSCSGGGGGGGGGAGFGFITIQSNTVTVDASGMAVAQLGGEAFVSSEYVAFRCSGLACIFGRYDDAYPGVDVFWKNLTTGTQGEANSRYGTLTDFDHLWSASVPLVGGVNQLEVRAADPAGNAATASVMVEYIPPAPNDLRANTGDGEITLIWSPIPEATAYRIYWATTPGDAFPFGTTIDVTDSPYVHSGLANGTTYYYAITSLYQSSESAPSAEIAATAGAPSQPTNLAASLVGPDVQLTWDAVATADTYTLYWANEPGVTKQNGTSIFGVISPFLHTELSGQPYYYVVTAVNGLGESLESEEVTARPPTDPPAPEGLTATQRSDFFGGPLRAVDLNWQAVPGASAYQVYRCSAGEIVAESYPETPCDTSALDCASFFELIGNSTDAFFTDFTVNQWDNPLFNLYYPYRYYVTTGTSMPSNLARLCVAPTEF
jgi:fibronectin type 3 domain-containing protein